MLRLLLLCPLAAALAQAATLRETPPRRPDDAVRYNGNNGWGGGFGRGGLGTGAMMLSGWGPRMMTAFTSTGGDLLPPPQDDDQDNDRSGDERATNGGGVSRANANASFNAWFPIVLGMFPGGGGSGGRSGADGEGGGYPPIAAIANSISHGARGVATSHAVAYGGPPLEYRRQRSQPSDRQQPSK